MIGLCGRKYAIIVITILFSILSLSSCQSNKYDINVSKVKVHIKFIRFEKDLFSIPEKDFDKRVLELKKKYPVFFGVYIEQVIHAGDVSDSSYLPVLKRFIYNPYMQKLYKDDMLQFKNMHAIFKQITEGFRHVKYYYPNDTMPDIYTMISGMTYKVISYGPQILGVSTDMFLGSRYQFYPSRNYYQYQIRRFRKEYILPQTLKAYFNANFPEEKNTDRTLLSEMIYKGKEMFFVHVMAPTLPDSLILEYTGKQLKWVDNNEGRIWVEFVNKSLLYKKDSKTQQIYIMDAPFTVANPFPEELHSDQRG